jgi:hypothetical protein
MTANNPNPQRWKLVRLDAAPIGYQSFEPEGTAEAVDGLYEFLRGPDKCLYVKVERPAFPVVWFTWRSVA